MDGKIIYYQRNGEIILKRAKDYYKTNKEKLREQAKYKYRELSNEEKGTKRQKESMDEIDTIICLKKIHNDLQSTKNIS